MKVRNWVYVYLFIMGVFYPHISKLAMFLDCSMCPVAVTLQANDGHSVLNDVIDMWFDTKLELITDRYWHAD